MKQIPHSPLPPTGMPLPLWVIPAEKSSPFPFPPYPGIQVLFPTGQSFCQFNTNAPAQGFSRRNIQALDLINTQAGSFPSPWGRAVLSHLK